MAANQPPWPSEWLMTDERLGERLWQAIEALPTGAGVVFRHYGLTHAARLDLGLRIARCVTERNLVLAVAGSRQLAEQLGATMVHNPDAAGTLPCSMAIHDEAEARLARLAGAVLVFVGPVHPTRSHPGAPVLGPERAAKLARLSGCPAIALGGMSARRFRQLQSAFRSSFHGYAGIDCWLEKGLKT